MKTWLVINFKIFWYEVTHLKEKWLKIKDRAVLIKNKTINNLKTLGWLGSLVSITISLGITFSPSIILSILYILTKNETHIISAGAWLTFIIAPAGGTGTLLFFGSLLTTSTFMIKLHKKIGGKQ